MRLYSNKYQTDDSAYFLLKISKKSKYLKPRGREICRSVSPDLPNLHEPSRTYCQTLGILFKHEKSTWSKTTRDDLVVWKNPVRSKQVDVKLRDLWALRVTTYD